jgi:hypothetical protein
MALVELSRVPNLDDEDLADPVLSMLGVGRELWREESGDQLVERLRSEDALPRFAAKRAQALPSQLGNRIWDRIERHQGEQFLTASRLPLTFQVEGNGIWFFRNGRRIERKATRTQVEEAISRCPLKTTTEIKDLIDYPYLFAILMDRRIRGDSW